MEQGRNFDLFEFVKNYGVFQGETVEGLKNLIRRQDDLERRFSLLCEEVTKLRVFQGRTSLIIGLVISVVSAVATILVAKVLGLVVGGGG